MYFYDDIRTRSSSVLYKFYFCFLQEAITQEGKLLEQKQ